MLSLPVSVRIYLAVEPADMRRGHDGLAALVRRRFEAQVFEGHLFVFVGKRLDRCKILFWDRGGFVLYYKRLEKGRFRLPRSPTDTACILLDAPSLAMLLDGIDFSRVKRAAHWCPPNEKSVKKIDKMIIA